MSLIFKPCAGAAVVARDATCRALLEIEIDGQSTQGNLIVTGLTLELSGNYQVLHTVGDLVYFYSFGDRIGTLNLSGMSFIAPCTSGTGNANKYDIKSVYKKYNDKKATKAGGKAAKIVLNSGGVSIITLYGFLTGMRLDIADSQMGAIAYWAMRFEVLPDTN
jgi:hypothetical protein